MLTLVVAVESPEDNVLSERLGLLLDTCLVLFREPFIRLFDEPPHVEHVGHFGNRLLAVFVPMEDAGIFPPKAPAGEGGGSGAETLLTILFLNGMAIC